MISHHADHTLSSFCRWQSGLMGQDGTRHDHAILLTGLDICSWKNEPCDTLGKALGGAGETLPISSLGQGVILPSLRVPTWRLLLGAVVRNRLASWHKLWPNIKQACVPRSQLFHRRRAPTDSRAPVSSNSRNNFVGVPSWRGG